MATYKLLSVCGSGIVTSSHVSAALKSGLESRGITAEIRTCGITEANGLISNLKPHVIISTVDMDTVHNVGDIKVISGVPLLTGIQKGKMLDDLASYLKSI